MRNNKIRKVVKNRVIAIMVVLLEVVAISVIVLVDKKASTDLTKSYSVKDPTFEENARKYVPVEYRQFVTLIESFKSNHEVDVVMDCPIYDKTNNVTVIGLTEGYSYITGKDDNRENPEWCNGPQCSFETVVLNGTDTVVSCPVDLLARLVEDYESNCVKKGIKPSL